VILMRAAIGREKSVYMMRQLYIPASALLAYSYPFTTVLLLQTGVPTGPANLAIKAGLAILYLLSLVVSLLARRTFCIPG
jgi:hypothetical protein